MSKLMKNDKRIIRVLERKDDKVLIIDCIKRTMPTWVSASELDGYKDCVEDELYETTGIRVLDDLNGKERCVAQQRFTMIAPVLPFIGEEKQRSEMIKRLAQDVSMQTIRKYLTLYLCYQDISVLAPARREIRELSRDEKNIRWALNKYFYNQNKLSLKTVYAKMLKERYCDEQGGLLDNYPSFHQFKYFYRKYRKVQNHYISRESMNTYQRQYRPLLGEGVQKVITTNEAIGYAMLDATVCDIYLTDGVNVVGRPTLTACICPFTSLCLGFALSWEGGVYSLRNLMLNVISDKKKWCESKGVFIETEEWECNKLPAVLITDKGTEYVSDTFSQISELGVQLVHLPPYRADMKSSVERFFGLIQG